MRLAAIALVFAAGCSKATAPELRDSQRLIQYFEAKEQLRELLSKEEKNLDNLIKFRGFLEDERLRGDAKKEIGKTEEIVNDLEKRASEIVNEKRNLNLKIQELAGE